MSDDNERKLIPGTEPSAVTTLESEFEKKAFLYYALCQEIVKQIDELLTAEQIKLASPIEWRVKTWASIVEKLERNKIEPKTLSDLRDVAGVRVIALFKRDLKSIEKIIEENFSALHKEDTSSRLEKNQFGYGSIHYEVRPPDHWQKIPTLRKLVGLGAEIQVRTSSQHIWAAASHILQYKKEAHVPLPLRRTISRVAALLETVDLEFERVLSEREEYAEDISRDQHELPLNTESLRAVLNSKLPEKNRDVEREEGYADLLDELFHFDVRTTAQLENIITKHLAEAMKREQVQVDRNRNALLKGHQLQGTSKERTERGVFFTHVGLIRATLDCEFPKKYMAYLQRKVKGTKTSED